MESLRKELANELKERFSEIDTQEGINNLLEFASYLLSEIEAEQSTTAVLTEFDISDTMDPKS